MLVITLICGAAAAVAYWFTAGTVWVWPIVGLCVLLWAGGLAFFRDPERVVSDEPGALIAPADGKVVETAELEHHEDVDGPARRLSIFLSVFDVHINRSPCAGVVRAVRYRPGKFLDARNPDSGSLNEANTVVIEPTDPEQGPVVVRQIAGLIARRIVCSVKVGDRVEAGQRIGLIKFGSRTELIVPAKSDYAAAVNVGDRARGGVTVMARSASKC